MLHHALAAAFAASQYALTVNLDGISHQESLAAPAAAGSSVNWIAGHILTARGLVLGKLGGEAHLGEDEAKPYSRGTSGLVSEEECLDLDRLREGLEATARELQERLTSLDPAVLETAIDPASLPMPVAEPTVGVLLNFLMFHEGYHVGQLGLSRRLLGKTGAIA